MKDTPAGDQGPPGTPAEDDPWAGAGDAPAWPEAFDALREHPRMGPVVEAVGPVRLPPPDPDPFRALSRSIVFQQLAGKAAATIWSRVETTLGGAVTPTRVLATPEEELRGAGLSRAKLAALQDLARRASGSADGVAALELGALAELDDEAVMRTLVQVRGIGPWTARMHLIFQLQRPDVWPVGDLAVRLGWARIHLLNAPPDPRALEPMADPFRPWRSAVAWYCWRVVDTDMEIPE